MESTKFKIIGVDCISCLYAIKKKLSTLNCIDSIQIDVNTGLAEITYDGHLCKLRDIYNAIRDIGYDVSKERILLYLKGLSPEEKRAFEEQIVTVRGVFDARVSMSTDNAVILFNPLEVDRDKLIEILREWDIKVVVKHLTKSNFAERTILHRRVISFTIGLTALALSMATMIHDTHVYEEKLTIVVPLMAFIALIMNFDIIIRGLRTLLKTIATMDSLIAISSLSTYTAGILSLTGILSHHSLHALSFFEASSGIIGFVGLGRYLEERLRYRALRSVQEFSSILKKRVRVVQGESFTERPVGEIVPGEIVEVKAGEIIPVDGVIVEGVGYVDESSFTGEPTPSLKRAESRDPVLAGSFLVSGYIRVRVTRVGEDTLLAYIMESVREAEFTKPRVARVADKAVGYFTWIVLALALITLIYWLGTRNIQLAVFFMAAVLTIACPCALGIAIPLAISVGVLRLSRRGLIIRRGDIFERITNTRVILFDKTGTLTHGKPVLRGLHILESLDDRELLSYVCSIESRSEHPISTAMLEKCREMNINTYEPSEYIGIAGEGIYGVVNEVRVAVGNSDLVSNRLGIELDDKVRELIYEIGSRGNTPVIVALNTRVVGVLEIGDKIRDEAARVVLDLKKGGFKVGVASGDTERNVQYYKNLLGLDLAFWSLRPAEKADIVTRLRETHGGVIFVGDGVNDAPAITRADVGIAMGKGSEISKEAGDAVIVNNNLESILLLIDFSKVVRRKMIGNLIWALVYNITLIPVAMGLFYSKYGLLISPQMAAIAMVLSNISVILNSISVRVSHGQ